MSEISAPSSSKQPCEREDALAVLKRLREAGHVAYFAGGCVRDELMGEAPKDYDIATDAPPQRVRELFSQTQSVGAAFGVILVRHRKSVVEVATFRTDVSYTDGRRPTEVRFTTAEEDARRRDFTINGLFLDPIENRVIDFVAGQEDIQRKLIRAIGEPSERFEEDHLRLLRAVRFAARSGFTIEPATAAAIRTHAEQLRRISPERVAEELRLMLTPPTRSAAWDLLWEFGLIDQIMRFQPPTPPKPLQRDRSIMTVLSAGQTIGFGLALAAGTLCYRWQREPAGDGVRFFLCPEEVRTTCKAMRQALRISNEELHAMRDILLGLRPLLAEPIPGVSVLKRFLQRPVAAASMELMSALHDVGECRQRIEQLRTVLANLTDIAPAPLVTGDDLIAEGLQPGPLFRHLLDHLYDRQLEGEIQTREQALELARTFGRD